MESYINGDLKKNIKKKILKMVIFRVKLGIQTSDKKIKRDLKEWKFN